MNKIIGTDKLQVDEEADKQAIQDLQAEANVIPAQESIETVEEMQAEDEENMINLSDVSV